MNAISSFLYNITGIAILIGGLYFMSLFSDMEENRSKVLIDDEVKKSSISLNISASSGTQELSWEEAYTSVMTCPLDISVSINGNQIPIEYRKLAERKQQDLAQYISAGTYKTSYMFGANGEITEIHFVKMEG